MIRTRRSGFRLRQDDGAGTILMAAGASVLLVVLGAVVVVSDLVSTRQRAGTAADLAALAAAHSTAYGSASACRQAADVAAKNGATLRSCRVQTGAGLDADVTAALPVRGPLKTVAGWLGLDVPLVAARAVAGPARTN